MRLSSVALGVLGVGLLTAPAVIGWVQNANTPIPVTADTTAATARIVTAANAFLATLNEAERAKALFATGDAEQAKRWSNLPSGIFQRAGVKLGDLTAAQKIAAMAVVQSALSRDGYRKVVDIMRGDEYLRTTGGGAPQGRGGRAGGGPAGPGAPPGPGGPGGPGGGRGGRGGGGGLIFGEAEYFISFVGAPSTTAPWLLQFGGHHLAINLAIAGGRSAMTPSLPAVQPATFTIDGQSIKPLGDEEAKGVALVNALDASQRAKAVLSYSVTDLVLGPGKDGQTIQPEGIPGSALSAAQRTLLIDVINEWAGIVTEPYAQVRLDEIRANIANTYFAWSGPTTAGSVAYYRIQGPTIVIEYAPQGSVDHIHTIYRDPTNDYGARLAAR